MSALADSLGEHAPGSPGLDAAARLVGTELGRLPAFVLGIRPGSPVAGPTHWSVQLGVLAASVLVAAGLIAVRSRDRSGLLLACLAGTVTVAAMVRRQPAAFVAIRLRAGTSEGARQAAVDGADRIRGQPRAATARVRSGCPVGHAGGSGAPHVDRRSPPGRARHTRLKLCTTLWTSAPPALAPASFVHALAQRRGWTPNPAPITRRPTRLQFRAGVGDPLSAARAAKWGEAVPLARPGDPARTRQLTPQADGKDSRVTAYPQQGAPRRPGPAIPQPA